MKKILFISPTGTLDNGAELSIIQLMSLLKEKDYSVVNVIQSGYSESRDEYKKVMDELDIPLNVISISKWWWPEAPGGIIQDMSLATAEYREAIAQLRTIIEKYEIDLVISNTVNVYLGAIAASISEIPHYWIIHEFPENEFSYYRSKVPFISDMSNAIFTVDGNLKETWSRLLTERDILGFLPYTKVIPKERLPKGDKIRFVSIGRINERKNQIALLKAYKILGNFDIELFFIGPWDEDYKVICNDYIEKNKLTNVKFSGYQNNPWDLVTDKDICVFPSQMETFGLVYIEAVLNGLPVIASDNIGHQTVQSLFELPVLYPKNDIQALSERLNQAASSFEQIKEEANYLKENLYDKYTPEIAYQSILEKIERDNAKFTGSLQAIEFLLTTDGHRTKLENWGRRLSHYLTKLRQKIL